MTVPPGFQRMAAIPRALRLHGGRLTDDDVETIESVRVTTPLRTLIDVIVEDRLARELQVQAVQEALRRGLVTLRQFDTVQTSRRARHRINTVLKQVPDGGKHLLTVSGYRGIQVLRLRGGLQVRRARVSP